MLRKELPNGIGGVELGGGFPDHGLRQIILAARPDVTVAVDDGEANFGDNAEADKAGEQEVEDSKACHGGSLLIISAVLPRAYLEGHGLKSAYFPTMRSSTRLAVLPPASASNFTSTADLPAVSCGAIEITFS